MEIDVPTGVFMAIVRSGRRGIEVSIHGLTVAVGQRVEFLENDHGERTGLVSPEYRVGNVKGDAVWLTLEGHAAPDFDDYFAYLEAAAEAYES